MKELSIEQKTKAYDEALEKARKELKACGSTNCDAARQIFRFFPELKESEDERIKKGIYNALRYLETVLSWDALDYGVDILDAYAWLEKQSGNLQFWRPIKEQYEALDYAYNSCPDTERGNYYEGVLETLIEDLHRLEKQKTVGEIVERCKNSWYNEGKIAGKFEGLTDDEKYQQAWHDAIEAAKEEKVDNQNCVKSVDKAEPRFHKGEWVVTDKNDTVQIATVNPDYYILNNGMEFSKSYVDKYWHLWTIKDAKDGDVLKEDSCTFIIERMKPDKTAIIHCCLFDDGDFGLGSTLSFDVDSTYPATKEQRDLLFQKMKEAGYEWDAEKKELKIIDWSKRIKYNPNAPSINKEKPTWSEEDDKISEDIIRVFKGEISFTSEKENKKYIDWLKSLKERIGG